jgi:hypothetical protein
VRGKHEQSIEVGKRRESESKADSNKDTWCNPTRTHQEMRVPDVGGEMADEQFYGQLWAEPIIAKCK